MTAKALAGVSLRVSEERLTMALEASGNVGTWEWDLASDILVGDERMAQLYGIDPRLAREGHPPPLISCIATRTIIYRSTR